MTFLSQNSFEIDLTDQVLSEALKRSNFSEHQMDQPIGNRCISGKDGATMYFRDNVLHRDGDEPAFVTQKFMMWFKNGKLHRENGLPSAVYANGWKKWHIDGVLQHQKWDNESPL